MGKGCLRCLFDGSDEDVSSGVYEMGDVAILLVCFFGYLFDLLDWSCDVEGYCVGAFIGKICDSGCAAGGGDDFVSS